MSKRNQTILNHFIRDYDLREHVPSDTVMHLWANSVAVYYARYHNKAYKPLYNLLMTAREVVKMEKLLDE